MRFTTLCLTALGFIGLAMSQGSETTLTTRPCNNPKYCTTVRTPPARSNAYTSKETTDSTELTRTITAHRRQLTVIESHTRASVHTSKSIKTHKPPKPSKTKTSGDSEIPKPSEGFSDSVRPTRVSVTAQRRQALPTTATCTEITEWDSKTDIAARQEAEVGGKPVYVVTVTHVKRVTARQEAGPTDLVEVMTNTDTKEAGPIDPIVVITVTKTHDIDERQEAEPTNPVYVVTVTDTISTTARQETEPTDPVYVVTVTDTETNAPNPLEEPEPTDPVYVITVPNPITTTAHQEPDLTNPVYVVTLTNTLTNTPDINARHIPDEISASLPPAVTAADYGCPPGTCGPACRSGHYCNKLLGRVAAVEDGVSKEPLASEEPVPTRGG
ncbi:hypothetical protein J4E81_009470 [Alternaria sp. BMP 2799]|nr:hypothetical protein J4E81_009470 [Alternaria sp. BMP 2799]